MIRILTVIVSIAGLTSAGFAQQDNTSEIPDPRRWDSRGEINVQGERVRYRVVAGETHLKNDDGEPTGSIFSTTYIRDGNYDPRSRPVAFIFNGGPGSASLWLHMGVFGPRRVVLSSEPPGDDGAAPFNVQSNPESLIDVADLVFVDPVGTGFSHALGDTDPGETFWGVNEDAASLSQFIRLWLTENNRWSSPKYLLGESYGTTRIGALMNQLNGAWDDVAINGVVLISVVLDFKLDETSAGNDIGYIGLMPGYAATAWYHGKVDQSAWGGDYDRFLQDARDFATDAYLPALVRGVDMPSEERDQVIARLSDFIGLSETYLRRAHMRVSLSEFRTELLRDRGLSVGRLDSRFTAVEPNGNTNSPQGDPSGFGIDASYTAAMRDYFSRVLGVEMDRPYETLSYTVFPHWNWDAGTAGGNNSYVNVSPWLERSMRQNSDFRILAMNGIYDLATPFFATEMTFNRPTYQDQDRIELTYYEAGHMMYLHQPSIEAMARDVREFIAEGN